MDCALKKLVTWRALQNFILQNQICDQNLKIKIRQPIYPMETYSEVYIVCILRSLVMHRTLQWFD
jgi:hypothetical protein